jgi:hypothetical protein
LPPTVAASARHFTDATSDPVSGSVTEIATINSPVAIGGSPDAAALSRPREHRLLEPICSNSRKNRSAVCMQK